MDASSIHDAYGAILFSSPFLWVERVVGRTAQCAVWLWLEVGSRKEAHTARCRPCWRSIDDRGIALVVGTFQSKAGLLLTLRVGVWARILMQSPFTERVLTKHSLSSHQQVLSDLRAQ